MKKHRKHLNQSAHDSIRVRLLVSALVIGLLGCIAPGTLAEPDVRRQAEKVKGQAKQLTLPSWVGDHMLVPADRPVPIRGTATPGIKVKVEFAGQKKHAVADEQGQWQVLLDAMTASDDPRVLNVSSTSGELKRYSDVLVGDTWLCSGQSNMNFQIRSSIGNEQKAAANAIADVEVRYFNGRSWAKLTSKNIMRVSAVGAWFTMEMARRKGEPAGLVVAGQGGTDIEAWIPKGGFPDTEHGKRLIPLIDDPEVLRAAEEDRKDMKTYGEHRLAKWGLGRAVPTSLYEKHIKPLADIPFSGVVWYQGESNALAPASAQEYRKWLKGLVVAWRDLFESPEMPFLIIQLPEFDPDTAERRANWARVQKEQAAAAKEMDGVWLVETTGLGDPKDIHPRRKQEVGTRAADVAASNIE